ncbi:MAG TPA: flagellar biosynthesis protein FlhF [Desulfurivibrio alkaliphilus]|uniref:Flagellar biosynthesis protein FlhF n=1 Tax=Desulfurivibrio alkaliphilus TaxID=427923 RepID=A0A7C2THV0_9BACT|nr:flagellar biosynthesis protein FlhF [Desulfurivibrio alkaliphilus]
MKVKRFEAPNTKSALALVKEELGSEAVILSTRTVRPESGAPGYGRTASWVEVVAAVDFDLEETIAAGSPAAPPARPVPRQSRRPAPLAPRALPPDDSPAAGVNLSREARLLQQRFGTWRGERQEADPLSVSPTPRRPTPSPTSSAPHSPQGKNGRPRPEEVASWRDQILEQLNVRSLDLGPRGAGPLVIALVGPTGVGKTTTAAKIAAWFSLHENASVALLSMDCYRIGATEQLRTYARIMQLPCEVALREQDLARALHKHRHKDLIIIDTAGKSPFDESHIPELHRWFSPHAEIMPYLVLSATAKKEDINHIIAAYRPLGIPAAILTKLDETRAYAALCQQMARAELPIACLCTGQKVPEDFLPATKDFLKTLFGRGWEAAMTSQQSVNQAAGWLQ